MVLCARIRSNDHDNVQPGSEEVVFQEVETLVSDLKMDSES